MWADNSGSCEVLSQSPDEDSLSSDTNNAHPPLKRIPSASSQSPDEDSLSSDFSIQLTPRGPSLRSLNPLTRIHCLPTRPILIFRIGRFSLGLNPLTRIHCLPTNKVRRALCDLRLRSQSPDEDSLSSDSFCLRRCDVGNSFESQSPDEDSLSSDPENPAKRPPR